MKLPLKVVPIEGDRDFVNVRDAANHRVVEVIRKADGEALVTACNAHDQLVAALTATMLTLGRDGANMANGPHRQEWEAARAALTAAGAA